MQNAEQFGADTCVNALIYIIISIVIQLLCKGGGKYNA